MRLETADGKTLLGYRVDDVLTFLCEAGELLRQQPETSDMGNYLGGIVLSLSVLGLTTAIARATGAPLYPAAE